MKNNKIFPIRKKCDCGKEVTDHHFKCNKCWGKKSKIKSKIKTHEFTKKHSRSSRGRKVLDEKIKQLKIELKDLK